MTEALERRLHELEIKLTFLDDGVSGLLSADAQLLQRLGEIERQLGNMRAELAMLHADTGHAAAREPPPPHY